MYRRFTIGALVAVALTGCGPRGLGASALDVSDLGALPPQSLMSAAAVKTANVDSLRFTMTMAMGGAGSTEGFSLTGNGVVDVANKRGAMTLEMGDDLALGMGDAASEMVFEEDRLYMKLPQGAGDLFPGAKPWIVINSSGLGSPAARGAFGPVSGDPTAGLKSLEGLDNVKPLGSESVRGVATTHYQGEFSFEGLLGNPLAGLGGGMASDLGPLTLDVWIDDEGLVRRLAVAMPVPDLVAGLDVDGAESTGPQTITVTLEMYDFGVPVEVTVPSESEVTDFNDLLQNVEMPDFGALGA